MRRKLIAVFVLGKGRKRKQNTKEEAVKKTEEKRKPYTKTTKQRHNSKHNPTQFFRMHCMCLCVGCAFFLFVCMFVFCGWHFYSRWCFAFLPASSSSSSSSFFFFFLSSSFFFFLLLSFFFL